MDSANKEINAVTQEDFEIQLAEAVKDGWLCVATQYKAMLLKYTEEEDKS